MLNKSVLFDNLRNAYSKISTMRFLEKEGRAILPLRYFFELTHLCNLNCPYCYVAKDKKERIKKELSFEDWKNVISQIPRFGFITLVGGEPLIRKDFSDILFCASKRVFGKVNVVTNGVLMEEKIIDDFIKSKMLLVSVSLDGWGKIHDQNRGQEGIFSKIQENLEILNKKRKKSFLSPKLLVDIKTIVLKDNLEDILKLYEYSAKMGFEFFSISFLRNNNLKQNSHLEERFEEKFYLPEYKIEKYFDLEKFKEIYFEIQKIKKSYGLKAPIVRFSPKFENKNPKKEFELIRRFFEEYQDLHPREIYKPCLYPYSNTIINPKGDIYPCLSVKMGNVKEQSIKEILNNPIYKCFRKNLKYSKAFSSCNLCCELTVKERKNQ